MRAAPFELDVTTGRAVRAVLAVVGGLCAAALASWVWSHVDAAAGPSGRGLWPWIAVGLGAAAVGVVLGWTSAPPSAGVLGWHQGQWVLRQPPAQGHTGTVHAVLDGGSWMLLCFHPADGGPANWLPVSRRGAGPAWHPLRATLFAPGAAAAGRDVGGDARS